MLPSGSEGAELAALCAAELLHYVHWLAIRIYVLGFRVYDIPAEPFVSYKVPTAMLYVHDCHVLIGY